MKEKIKKSIRSNKAGEYIYHRFLDIKYNTLQLLPLRKRIKLQHFIRTRTKLNLSEPQTFSDWTNMQKLDKNMHKTMALFADKYLVKDIVKDFGVKCDTIETLKVYNKIDQLKNDLDKFTYPIIIKMNFGSAGTYLLENINDFDKIELDLNYRYNVKYSKFSAELHYDIIDRKIMIEPYIGDKLTEYKIYCSRGEILFYISYNNKGIDSKGLRNMENPWCVFCKDDSIAPFVFSGTENSSTTPTDRIKEMKEMAMKMSTDFDLVRIDFMFNGRDIYFGEFTFTSHGGYFDISPKKYDYKLGSEINNIING